MFQAFLPMLIGAGSGLLKGMQEKKELKQQADTQKSRMAENARGIASGVMLVRDRLAVGPALQDPYQAAAGEAVARIAVAQQA